MERRKTPFLAQRAGELRNESSATEARLWARIRNRQVRGYRFRRRPVVLGKIPDFGCSEAKLVIEIDGYPSLGKKRRDDQRDSFLSRHSITTIHIPADLIWKNLEGAVQLINAALPTANSTSGRRRRTL